MPSPPPADPVDRPAGGTLWRRHSARAVLLLFLLSLSYQSDTLWAYLACLVVLAHLFTYPSVIPPIFFRKVAPLGQGVIFAPSREGSVWGGCALAPTPVPEGWVLKMSVLKNFVLFDP